MITNPSASTLAIGVLVGIIAGAAVALLLLRDDMPWGKVLRNMCQPKYRFQSTPFESVVWSIAGTTLLSIVLFSFTVFVFLPPSLEDAFESSFALVFLMPLATLRQLQQDFILRGSAKKKGNDPWRYEPLNFKIYLVDAIVTFLSVLASVSTFWLVVYVRQTR